MAGKPMDLPKGVEIFRNSLRTRFTWTLLRRVIAETDWTSANVKRNAITRLATILDAATREGLLTKNPAVLVELPKRSRKEIDPFTLAEANTIIRQTSDPHKQWVPVLNEMGIRRRPPYNCRHTYATMCAMSGLNPAFIAQQLGHSVQMLLSTYARWLNSSSDWSELEKLKIGIKSVSAESPAS